MERLSLSRFSTPGTLQSRPAGIEGDEGSLSSSRAFVGAPRQAEVQIPLTVDLDAHAYLAAAPSYLVPGARRFGLIQFSTPGTLQSRPVGVADQVEVSAAATRSSWQAHRLAGIGIPSPHVHGQAAAQPDLSPGVTAVFEEVYSV